MSMRKSLPLVLFACLALCVAAPVASARTAHAAAGTPSNKQLNSKIKKANAKIKALGAAVATLTTDQKNTAATLKTIVDAAPQLISGLTALKDALTPLGTAYQSVEYGVMHTVLSVTAPVNANLADMPNQYSGDIPDDGNGAQVSGAVPFTAPNLGVGNYTLTPNVRASIRSAEGDGKATGDPAGEVGGLIYVTCGSAGGCGPAPAGSVMCAPGQTPADFPFTDPSTGNTSVKTLEKIQVAAARTDQSRPSDDPSDVATANATAGNRFPFTAVPGSTYIVNTTFQFFDLPTSTSPGPSD